MRKLMIWAISSLGIVGWMLACYVYYTKENAQDNFSANHTYNYVRAMVWYHSRGKLEELKSILQTENLKDIEATKLKIRNMLQHRTSAYIRDFNYLKAPIPMIGNVYGNIFDFDGFLEAVYEVAFDDTKTVDGKINRVADIMEEYQIDASNKLLTLMKKEK
jgi:hypothetical protein